MGDNFINRLLKGLQLYSFRSLNSTNTWAKENVQLLDRDKITLISADQQTNGYGRFNRKWLSPKNENIYCSFCFFLPPDFPHLSNISQILSISIANALEEWDFAPQFKWPNDILLSKKKLGGILTETLLLEEFIFIVAGMGLNVNMPEDTAKKIDQPATSLFIESGKLYDPKALLTIIKTKFENHFQEFIREGFTPFFNDYTARLIHTEKGKLLIKERDKDWEGFFKSINNDGSLNMKLLSGESKTFYGGEIIGSGT